MMLIRTFLAPSEIQGLGVFAGEFVPSGSELWMLTPKFDIFISVSELDMLPPHMQDFVMRFSYPHLEMPGVRVLDCDDGKFMNHSERPNTDFRVFDKGYALTDIAVADEITCNYYEFDPAFRGFGRASSLDLAITALQAPDFSPSARTRP
ncbi:MAG: SET domain-containing protein-lysine N-methyltransferase [Methyloceanibacter sp.]